VADDRFTHHCQPLDDCMEELRVVRLIHAMRPYLPSSPLPPRSLAARIPRQRRRVEVVAEQRIRDLQPAGPQPAPDEPEPWWPVHKGVRRPPPKGRP
jgi:hypothetical protein